MYIYEKRRERLTRDLNDNYLVFIYSGNAVNRSEDENYEFVVNRNFYYLTGLEKESMILVLSKLNGMYSEHLFILPFDKKEARWVGGRMLKEEASEVSNVKNVHNFEELNTYVASYLNRARAIKDFKIYFDFWHYSFDQKETEAIKYANELKAKYPAITFKDIYPYISKMRLIKDEYEVACIKEAIKITDSGIKSMMKIAKPGLNEMVMEGIFNFTLAQNKCNENAFKTIAASGERATILHYSDNNCDMQDNELFLCDLGATYSHYCADITRTFPVNGKFTERQKEIYTLVLQAQELVRSNARPGVKMKDLNRLVVEFYKRELPKHNLNEDIFEYYFHSVSHHLGLDTHDVDGGLGQVLEAGNVITNEPGLYIASEGIGVRIEDDLLITGTGCEVLSSSIIKEIDDIEAFMQNNQA